MVKLRGKAATLVILGTLASPMACKQYTVRSEQRIVSQSAYPRHSPLVGPRKGVGGARLGGSAEYSLVEATPEPGSEKRGGHLIPTGRAEGYVAFQVTRRLELGVSGGAYFADSRLSVDEAPLQLETESLGTGGFDGRLFIGDSDLALNFGARLAKIHLVWDYEDKCTGDCDFGTKTGGRVTDIMGGSVYGGFGGSIPIGRRFRVILGVSVEAMTVMATREKGSLECGGGSCSDNRPPKPPEPHLGLGASVHGGLDMAVGGPLHARIMVQPVAHQPDGGTQYLVTQAGLEAAF